MSIGALPDTLEPLVDRYNLCEILAALCTVCGDKAAYLRAGGEGRSAKNWDRLYKLILQTHDTVQVIPEAISADVEKSTWKPAKSFKVGTARAMFFDTLEEASQCANDYFRKTGIVVEITEV